MEMLEEKSPTASSVSMYISWSRFSDLSKVVSEPSEASMMLRLSRLLVISPMATVNSGLEVDIIAEFLIF